MDIVSEIKFDKDGLVSVIAQDYESNEVLMFAYANAEAVKKTFETGKVHYYSRSRKALWLKGETSGHFQIVKEIYLDCDKDAVLIKIEQIGNACHTNNKSCLFNKVE